MVILMFERISERDTPNLAKCFEESSQINTDFSVSVINVVDIMREFHVTPPDRLIFLSSI
jgi:hypothetical protein